MSEETAVVDWGVRGRREEDNGTEKQRETERERQNGRRE
jgi:hypothetical protein